jgi:nucleoside-diphosphate-sugar epimerase
MTRTLVWVVGEGGLLGSHVRRLLAVEVPGASPWARTGPRFPWEQPAQLEIVLTGELSAFLAAARAGFDAWAIVWCAGAGVVQTSEAALTAETETFERFLSNVGAQLGRAGIRIPGLIALASSAGSVYGNYADGPLTEDTPCRPISQYGREKLRQEGALRACVETTPDVGWLIGRLSTLYGTGQNLAKPQGFISQMVRTLLFRRPMHVYVPLDTQRDFLYVEDAARHLLCCMTHLLSTRTPGRAVKIFATGRSVALSEIVALLRRISKQPVRILSSPNPERAFHPAKLVFRSVALGHVRLPPVTNLAAGLAAVYHHQLGLLRRGVLPPPATT